MQIGTPAPSTRFRAALSALVGLALLATAGCGGSVGTGGPTDCSVSPTGTSCGPSRVCCRGACGGAECIETLAADQPYPSGIAVDGSNVYWSTEGCANCSSEARGVYAMPLAGGAVVTLSTEPSGGSTDLVIDATSAYWNEGYGNLVTVPLSGGPPVTLARELCPITELALNALGVYWHEIACLDVQNGGFTIGWIAPGGSTNPSLAFVGNGKGAPPGAFGLAANSEDVFWGEANVGKTGDHRLLRVVPGAGKPEVLTSGADLGYTFAADDDSVYWITPTGDLVRQPLSGGETRTLASGQTSTGAITLDTTRVYWIANRAILTVLKTGGATRTIAGDQDTPWHVAIDDTSVYWTNVGGRTDQGTPTGTVMRATPK